ncbi:MAG: tetratricopeptide repeat protein [Bacteroidetes bacterium]|nr:tetratricopeptide repeat protein [Bacteroidota bacterium]
MKHLSLVLLILCKLGLFGQANDKYDKIVDSLKRIGQEEKLIPYFKEEIRSNPKNEKALRWLGYLHIADNQLDIGEKYYNDALAVNPKCARCYMNMGRIYLVKNDNTKALELFDRSIAIDPKDAILYITRANLKEYLDDKPGALADYNKTIELDSKNANYFIQRGNFISHQNNFSDAISDLNKAVELAPDNYNSYFQRASVYFSNQMLQEALADINTAIQLESNLHSLFTGRGAIYDALNEYNKSIEDYSRSIELNPNDLLPYKNRALARYKLNDLDGSCRDNFTVLKLIKELDINDPSLIKEVEYAVNDYCDSTKPGFYFQRGMAFYDRQQFQNAVEIYTKGLKKFPKTPMALSFRGNSLLALKNYKSALESYYSALENKDQLLADIKSNPRFADATPENINMYYNGSLASIQVSIAICKFALGLYNDALSEIEKGITLAPDVKDFGKEDFHNVHGTTLLALEKYQKALYDFDKCITLNPGFAAAYVNRAVAKINLTNKTRMTLVKVKTDINPRAFNAEWSIPYKVTVNESDPNVLSALADCDKAIEMIPDEGYPHYMRGRIKKLLIYGNYCQDFIKARDLGYPVENEFLNDCGK